MRFGVAMVEQATPQSIRGIVKLCPSHPNPRSAPEAGDHGVGKLLGAQGAA